MDCSIPLNKFDENPAILLEYRENSDRSLLSPFPPPPASISSPSYFDPGPVSRTRHLCGTRLLSEHVKLINFLFSLWQLSTALTDLGTLWSLVDIDIFIEQGHKQSFISSLSLLLE